MSNEAGRGDSGNCQVNVNCSEGLNWQNEKKGIAMILVSGTRWCSGSLVNNTSNNQTPYFLTANHCIGSLDANGNTDASYYSFWWNYESSTCSTNSADYSAESTSGAILVANNSASDFALFQLAESPLDNNIDVYFNGWDRTTSPTQGGVGIHHPSGDFKKIATHNQIPSPGQVWNSNTHWRVNWSQTANGFSVTEGGSSGSPLFTNNKRIIGQLHGGSNINCSNPANDPGEYGKFHVSWNGSSSQRRLKDWLDPMNTNQSYLNGIAPIPPITFQSNVDIVCDSNISFTLQGASTTPTWSNSSNLDNISANSNSITVRALSSNVGGQGYVRATFANGTFVQEDFWVGVPVVDYDINEDFTMCRDINSTTNNFFAVNTQGVDGSTTWEVQTITNNHTVGMQGNEVLVSLEYAPPYSYIAFKVRASNSCGFSNWLEYYIDVINNCGSENYQSYMVSPNPSSESVTIEKKSSNSTSTNSNNKIEYKLYDFNYNLIYEGSLVNDKATINVSNFKKSIYILKIYGTKEEETHQIIVK